MKDAWLHVSQFSQPKFGNAKAKFGPIVCLTNANYSLVIGTPFKRASCFRNRHGRLNRLQY